MKFYNQLLDETLIKKTFDNGFSVYVLPKKNYTKKHVYMATEYGSMYNEFLKDDKVVRLPLGMAHFLEHKIFEAKNESIFDTFEKLGASVNAYTNFFSTCYTFSTVHHFDQALLQLIDLIQNLEISEASVEKEKPIICRELMMYEDQPQWQAFKNMLKGLYHDHPIKHDVGGTVESVKAITKEDLELAYESFYTPDRMIMFVIGDLEPENVFKTVEKGLSQAFMKRPKAPRVILPEKPKEIVRPYYEEQRGLKMPLFYLGIKDRVFYDNARDRLVKGIASKILADLLFGKGSDFYEKHYGSRAINGTFACDFAYGRTFGYTAMSAETKNPERLKDLIQEEIDHKKKVGLSEEGFLRIKRKMIGRHLSSFNSTQYIASTFMSYYMKGIELFDYLETLENLTFDQVVNRFQEHYNLDYSTVSVVI